MNEKKIRKFEELIKDIAQLKEGDREKVSIYIQGMMAVRNSKMSKEA